MLSKVKKGDTVAIVGFTGIRLTDTEVTGASKTQIKVLKTDGAEMIFDRKTGVQKNVEEGKEKYANKAMLPADAPVNKKREKKVKPPKKTKEPIVVEEEPEEGEFDEEFEEDEEEPKKAKKPAKKSKKPAKKVEEEFEEDDDFDDDDFDDDDFEEI